VSSWPLSRLRRTRRGSSCCCVGTPILIVHLWYWFLPRDGAGGMLAFAMSKAKRYEPIAESVTFDDVAGSNSGGPPSQPRNGRSPRQRCPRGTAQRPDPLMSDDAGLSLKNTQVRPSGIRAAKDPGHLGDDPQTFRE